MIRRLAEFVDELRAIGIPVSMVEVIDAARAVEFTDLSSSEHLRATLGATLIKKPRHYRAFDRAFDVYFGLEPVGGISDSGAMYAGRGEGAVRGRGAGAGGAGGWPAASGEGAGLSVGWTQSSCVLSTACLDIRVLRTRVVSSGLSRRDANVSTPGMFLTDLRSSEVGSVVMMSVVPVAFSALTMSMITLVLGSLTASSSITVMYPFRTLSDSAIRNARRRIRIGRRFE